MASEALVLPRMRLNKNREQLFAKKRKEIEQTSILTSTERIENQKLGLVPHYIQALNQIRKSTRAFDSAPEQLQQASYSKQKRICTELSQQVSLAKGTHVKGSKDLATVNKKSRKGSLQPFRKLNEGLQVVISNGHSHDRTLPHRERKNLNLLRFKKQKQRLNMSQRNVEPKTSREQAFNTVEDQFYEQMISHTKYIHFRPHNRNGSDENSNTANLGKVTAPVKEFQASQSVHEMQETMGLITDFDPKLDQLERKYKDLIQGFAPRQLVRKNRQSSKRHKKREQLNQSLFNTLDLSGW